MESFGSRNCTLIILSFTIRLAVGAELAHIDLLGNLATKMYGPFLELTSPAQVKALQCDLAQKTLIAFATELIPRIQRALLVTRVYVGNMRGEELLDLGVKERESSLFAIDTDHPIITTHIPVPYTIQIQTHLSFESGNTAFSASCLVAGVASPYLIGTKARKHDL